MRITRDSIRQKVAVYGKPFNLSVDYAYGLPRVTANEGSRDISPRLKGSEMIWWLDGFGKGCELEGERVKALLQPLRERLEAWRDNAALMRRTAFEAKSGQYERWKNEFDNYERLIQILDKI